MRAKIPVEMFDETIMAASCPPASSGAGAAGALAPDFRKRSVARQSTKCAARDEGDHAGA